MTKLKIGVTYKVRKNLIPDCKYDGVYFVEEMAKYLGEEIKFKSINKEGNGENEEGWTFSEKMLQLIKPKSKKVKKWKYSREDVIKRIDKWFSDNSQKLSFSEIKEMLLTTQPKPIKEESKPHLEEDTREGYYCCRCGHRKGGEHMNCNSWGQSYKNHVYQWFEKKQQSKDIEFEEIEEINGQYVADGITTMTEIDIKINQLIRNQNKIIDYINSKEK